jgi:predicted ABC-type transport system involved in lysophospholipase L1 biosynthesis ATPase subunit
VWAFEPHPENFRCAELTLRLNALENVQLIAVLKDTRGEITFANEFFLELGARDRCLHVALFEIGLELLQRVFAALKCPANIVAVVYQRAPDDQQSPIR